MCKFNPLKWSEALVDSCVTCADAQKKPRPRPPQPKRNRVVDSSDDEAPAHDPCPQRKQDSSDDEAPASDSRPKTKPHKRARARPKFTCRQVDIQDQMDLTAKGPALTPQNAVGRFVFVPASVYQVDDPEIVGFIGCIVKVDNAKRTSIKFHDKTDYFSFEFASATFTPLE